jgi:LPS sulfotransferase NodH
MDGLLIITGQRTGAGHLISLLNNLPEVGVREEALPPDAGALGAIVDRAELDALARNQRVFVLRANSDVSRELIEAHILLRPGMRTVLVTRRMIDTYVSLAKAKLTDAWHEADTTNVKVTLNIDAFSAWLNEETLWYATWQEWMRRRSLPSPVLRYETHIAIPPEAALRRFTMAAGQVGISLRVPTTLPHPGLSLQDKGKGVAFKVTNWPEFSRALVERDLEKRAFGYPI